MKTTLCAFLLLLLGGAAATEEKSLEFGLAAKEDEAFWGRVLAGHTSMSVAPEKCDVEVSIACTVGEGEECNDFKPVDDKCVNLATYVFRVENTGPIPMFIDELLVTVNGESIAIDAPTGAVEPGNRVAITAELNINFCEKQTITTEAIVKGRPGPCEDKARYVLEIPGKEGPECEVDVEIVCTVGEGIECNSQTADPDFCEQLATYRYIITNTGDVPLEIDTVVRDRDPGDEEILTPEKRNLAPGEDVGVFDEFFVDFCEVDIITTTVTVTADPGACVDQETFILETPGLGRRRTQSYTRGMRASRV